MSAAPNPSRPATGKRNHPDASETAALARPGRTLSAPSALLVVALALPGLADAEIYRCQHQGVVEFSDLPCDHRAVVHDLPPISVVVPDPGLPQLAASSRAFIDARRASLADRKRRQPTPTPPAGVVEPRTEPQTVFVPWPVLPPRRADDRSRGIEQTWPTQRYSALHGPILGTRRNAEIRQPAPPRNNDPQRRP